MLKLLNKIRTIIPKRLCDIESLFFYFIINIYLFILNKRHIKKSDQTPKNSIIIFGSGYSINDIKNDQWQKINEKYDTIGFNHFYHCNKVKMDYYVIREFESLEPKLKLFKRFKTIFNIKHFKKIVKNINENINLTKTKFIFLNDYKSGASYIIYFLLKRNHKILGFYSNLINREKVLPISDNFKNIPHGKATLIDVINICYLLNYKKIILAGVDLYDRRYFYLKENETRQIDKKRGAKFSDTHNTSHLLKKIDNLNKAYSKKEVSLYVLNKKSLLTKYLPVYNL